MARIPIPFNGRTAAYDGVQDGVGTVHLSALVRSFLERECRRTDDEDDWEGMFGGDGEAKEQREAESYYANARDLLENVFAGGEEDEERRRIHEAVEKAVAEIGGNSSSPDFNRRLVALLRGGGLDAGICRSKCEKDGRRKYRDHEYVDVNADAASGGGRYIVVIFLAGEFTIWRPADGYSSLLETFPAIFVAKPNELRQVVKTMCAAVRRSMKSAGIDLPPWRRLAHMQSKWFGTHGRTTGSEVNGRELGVRRPGIAAPAEGIRFRCREVLEPTAGGRTGNLSAIMNQKDVLM
ncbi:Protein of unknown function (DUF506 [Striga hermonthica]|uniref:Uncharacterized protein n=1 Tax=Striga hermonthica TaxID=68872 RepID=A0A9N7NUC6_STRHE|nr:Protein of unknown function (DUF506 [Striga hermonthica]